MRLLSMLMSGLTVGAVCVAAVAQDAPPRRGGGGGGGIGTGDGPQQPPAQRGGQARGQLAPDKAKAAWELQARHLAQQLGLNDEQTKTVVAAYVDVREKHAQAMRDLVEKMRQPQDADPAGREAQRDEMQKKFTDLRKADREKLQAELTKAMSAEQVSQAMVPLGSFNPNWDLMVSTVAGFKLDQDKMKQAMDAMQSYVTTTAKLAEDSAGDPDARRTANQQARAKLTESMKSLLSESQFSEFQRTVGGREGGARRPGAAGRGPDAPAPGGRNGAGNPPPGGRGGRGGGQSPGGTPQ